MWVEFHFDVKYHAYSCYTRVAIWNRIYMTIIIIFSFTLLLLYFLICIATVFLFFFLFVVFLDCTSKALLTFFDCRGLAYSCVIIPR